MAKNKRKATSIVARRQNALHAANAGPNDHDHDGDGLVVLSLTIVPTTKPDVVPCATYPDPYPSLSSQPCEVDCYVASNEEILDEDQLDFNFLDEECDDSPQAPALLPAEKVPFPPPLPLDEKVPSPSLMKSVMPFSPPSGYRESPPSTIAVFGKSPGYRSLNSIISNVWKYEATLTIHGSGWHVYHFKTEEAKLTVLHGGPYLVYGRPLILWPMMKFFDFSSEELSRVPIWCDQHTSNLSRMSYARVLVEIDLLEEFQHSVEISFLEGLTMHQKVVYEGHTRLLCPKATTAIKIVPCHQPQAQVVQADKGTVFSRLGPQSPLQVSSPLPQVRWQRVVVVDIRWLQVVVVQSSRTDPLVATPCAEEVQGSSPSRTEPLVLPHCAGEGHNPSTPRTNSLATNTGDADIAGKSVNSPILDVSVQSGVRTRNQKQRGRSAKDIVSPMQNAFLVGRYMSDNINLVQELFHQYGRKRTSPRCLLKVDFEKAFDSVQWEFLERLLRHLGFPAKFVLLVMQCVSSASYSIVVNGDIYGFFQETVEFDKETPYPRTFSYVIWNTSPECSRLLPSIISWACLLLGCSLLVITVLYMVLIQSFMASHSHSYRSPSGSFVHGAVMSMHGEVLDMHVFLHVDAYC
uniref:DUF4283 domain-containing protein n=1 Tax=Populus alba TaxID=43335 RepID=A0A4U5QJP9_POPAL|nr:hypothetical protein D5086_0000078290 [Populus alba]